jgi:hypothetical protein
MVVTGFAAQPTNWDESEGGNATSGDHGKTYERMEPWEFTYDSFMGWNDLSPGQCTMGRNHGTWKRRSFEIIK